MKLGLRMPSLKRRILARTSWKRYVRHSMGIKAPRGFGFATNPKKAMYNKVYNKTSFSVDRVVKEDGVKRVKDNLASNNVLKYSSLWILILLLIIFWPIGAIYFLYKVIVYFLAKENRTRVEEGKNEKSLVVMGDHNKSVFSWAIPEPTRSLVFVTDDDLSKIKDPSSITITISLDFEKRKANTSQDNNKSSLYAEPSLIWTRLPVKANNDLETEAMYWPSYAKLSPVCRYQYLNWLRDITQETNLSFVFLYFYGLERHLLIGNYDLAVDEILKLLKYHDKGSFRHYVVSSLLPASVYRNRSDILERAPFVFDQVSDISLYLRLITNKELTAENIIELANRVQFYNKRYIKTKPTLFREKLQKLIDEYHNKNGFILNQLDDVQYEEQTYFANISIPDKFRRIKTPQIIENEKFKKIIFNLLDEAHCQVKEEIIVEKNKNKHKI